jgi:hypothetical protein
MNGLSLRRDPIRLLFSRAPWAGAWYLLGYLVVGGVLFSIAFTAAVTGAGLSITLVGLPVLVAAAVTIRWCADVERFRLRRFVRVEGGYQKVTEHGIMAQLRTRWKDPATWRDVAFVIGLFVPLLGLDTVVLAVWLVLLAGITLPAWYQFPHQTWTIGVSGKSTGSAHGVQLGYFPNGPHGHPGWGLYADTLPKALLAAAVCLVAFLLFDYVLVATARAHVAIARGLLQPHEDPLKEAKEVLHRPGPLSPLNN